jgi:ribosomal protein L7/L12
LTKQRRAHAMSDFDDERLRWDVLDPLVLSGAKLEFIVEVRRATGMGLPEAQDVLGKRYDLLRSRRPQDFAQAHNEYWADFYS